MDAITLTDDAATKIAEIVAEEKVGTCLRLFIQGSGCSGFSYGFQLDDVRAEDDYVVEKAGINLLVDPMSYQYLVGATVDYKVDLMGAKFTIDNPNTKSTCGCGESFSV